MTDYLEEHLDNAGRLLERMKWTDQDVMSLSSVEGSAPEAGKAGSALGPERALLRLEQRDVSENREEVDGQFEFVNQDVNVVENTTFEPDSAREAVQNRAEPFRNMEEEQGRVNQTSGALRPEDGWSGSAFPNEGLEGNSSGSALAAELRQMDWAVSVQAGETLLERGQRSRPVSVTGSRMRREQNGLAVVSESGWNGMGGWTGRQSGSDGGEQWAEQTDRVFRRDSRRYDGGFYLY